MLKQFLNLTLPSFLKKKYQKYKFDSKTEKQIKQTYYDIWENWQKKVIGNDTILLNKVEQLFNQLEKLHNFHSTRAKNNGLHLLSLNHLFQNKSNKTIGLPYFVFEFDISAITYNSLEKYMLKNYFTWPESVEEFYDLNSLETFVSAIERNTTLLKYIESDEFNKQISSIETQLLQVFIGENYQLEKTALFNQIYERFKNAKNIVDNASCQLKPNLTMETDLPLLTNVEKQLDIIIPTLKQNSSAILVNNINTFNILGSNYVVCKLNKESQLLKSLNLSNNNAHEYSFELQIPIYFYDQWLLNQEKQQLTYDGRLLYNIKLRMLLNNQILDETYVEFNSLYEPLSYKTIEKNICEAINHMTHYGKLFDIDNIEKPHVGTLIDFLTISTESGFSIVMNNAPNEIEKRNAEQLFQYLFYQDIFNEQTASDLSVSFTMFPLTLFIEYNDLMNYKFKIENNVQYINENTNIPLIYCTL